MFTSSVKTQLGEKSTWKYKRKLANHQKFPSTFAYMSEKMFMLAKALCDFCFSTSFLFASKFIILLIYVYISSL